MKRLVNVPNGKLTKYGKAACCLLDLFSPEDGGNTFLQTIGELLLDYTVTHTKR